MPRPAWADCYEIDDLDALSICLEAVATAKRTACEDAWAEATRAAKSAALYPHLELNQAAVDVWQAVENAEDC